MKRHISYYVSFSRKSHRLWDNVEKLYGDCRAINDVIIWRISAACWISKTTCTYAPAHAPHHTHTRTNTYKYVIFITFPLQQLFANAPLCYKCIVCLVIFKMTVQSLIKKCAVCSYPYGSRVFVCVCVCVTQHLSDRKIVIGKLELMWK